MSKRQAHCPPDPPCASSSPHQRIKGLNLVTIRGYMVGRLINPADLHVRLEFNTYGWTAHIVYGPNTGLRCFSSSNSPYLLYYRNVSALARLCTVQGIPVLATREHRVTESRHTRNPSCREAHDDQTLIEQDDCNTFPFQKPFSFSLISFYFFLLYTTRCPPQSRYRHTLTNPPSTSDRLYHSESSRSCLSSRVYTRVLIGLGNYNSMTGSSS